MKFSAPIISIFSFLLLLFSWGCVGLGGGGEVQPTYYYTLEPVDVPRLLEESEEPRLVIGLERVNVPEYLDRREITVRTGSNELRYTERHLWAEMPSDSIPRVLGLNIERQANASIEIHALPWPDHADPGWVVTMDIQSFEGQESPESNLLLKITWSIQSTKSGEFIKQGHFDGGRLDWQAGDYSALARGLSEGLTSIGRLIAKDLEELRQY